MLELLKERRRVKAAQEIVALMWKLRGINGCGFHRMNPATQNQYLRLLDFLSENKIAPKLYLRLMHKFNWSMFPNALATEKALNCYDDFIWRIKKRYKDVKTYSEVEDKNITSIVLQNDLYFAAQCSPDLSFTQFYADAGPQMLGYKALKKAMPLLKKHVDQKSYRVLAAIVKHRALHRTIYADLVRKAVGNAK